MTGARIGRDAGGWPPAGAAVPVPMPPAVSSVASLLARVDALALYGAARAFLVIAIHAAAFAVMLATEADVEARAAYVLFWGLLNFLCLALLRRPAAAAMLSLGLVSALILLSGFKHDILFMTVNFVDLMLIDVDTFRFLFAVFPGLDWQVGVTALAFVIATVAIFRLDPFRVRRRVALVGLLACVTALAGLAFALPTDPYDEFYRHQYVSKFARSGVT